MAATTKTGTDQGGRAFIGSADGNKSFIAMGVTLDLLAGKGQTGGMVEAVTGLFPPGTGVPLHYHERSDELLFLLEGELTLLTADEAVAAPTGTFVSLPRGVAHGFENRSQVPARTLILWTPSLGPGAEEVFTTLSNVPPGPPDMTKLVPLLQSLDMSPVPPKAG
jgi:quercetin dioxygenase-like cupin family protein